MQAWMRDFGVTVGVTSIRQQGKTLRYLTKKQSHVHVCSNKSFFIGKNTCSCFPCACFWSAALCKVETCFLLLEFLFCYCTLWSNRQVTLQLCPTNMVQMFITKHLMDDFKSKNWEELNLTDKYFTTLQTTAHLFRSHLPELLTGDRSVN